MITDTPSAAVDKDLQDIGLSEKDGSFFKLATAVAARPLLTGLPQRGIFAASRRWSASLPLHVEDNR
jgi:hypothetical protein